MKGEGFFASSRGYSGHQVAIMFLLLAPRQDQDDLKNLTLVGFTVGAALSIDRLLHRM